MNEKQAAISENNESESYWKTYYDAEFIVDPTPFGRFCQSEFFKEPLRILELGCGSGRDVRLFAAAGHTVRAIDRCPIAIQKLRSELESVEFLEGDFTQMRDSDSPWDCVYSRWSLHSVDEEGANRTLDWASRNIRADGLLCIEVRSVNDHLYGAGEPVGEHAYVTDHYRRFIVHDDLRLALESRGFEVVFEIEDSGLSVHKGDDPILIRMLGKR